jgi:hypothetical protein
LIIIVILSAQYILLVFIKEAIQDNIKNDSNKLDLEINRPALSNKSCFVCTKKYNETNLKSISKDGIIDVYEKVFN